MNVKVHNLIDTSEHEVIADRPRYVQVSKYADGSEYYRYNPDQVYVEEKVVNRVVLGTDRLSAYTQAIEFNKLIDEYNNKEKITREDRGEKYLPTVEGIADEYVNSHFFKSLKEDTQKAYSYQISILLSLNVFNKGKTLGLLKELHFEDITNGIAQSCYDQLINKNYAIKEAHKNRNSDGVTFANHILSVAKRIWNVANKWEITHRNPWRFVEKKKAKLRRTKWSPEQVERFLQCCFNSGKEVWYNVGVLVSLGYATSQRPGDCSHTIWDEIRFDKKTYHKVQSKKGDYHYTAEVEVPLEDDVIDLLTKQFNNYGNQKWVAPYPKTGEPFDVELLSKTFRRIANSAGLPQELQMRDIRRTVLSELADSGSTTHEIMSWSGHANPQSTMPYVTKSLRQSTSAYAKRKKSFDKKSGS